MSQLSNSTHAPEQAEAHRRFAGQLFRQVMQSVNVPRSMRECFAVEAGELRVGAARYDLHVFTRVLVAAVGKAAVPMAEHALQRLHGTVATTGVVVGVGLWEPPPGVVYLQGGHPVPDEVSLQAAQALLQLMRSADKDTLVVYLISGGASAMAEAPYDPGVPAEELFAFYQQLLHSGLPIGKTNTLRKHFSSIKGGRLAEAAGEATRCTLLISDVPPGKLDVVGSGPSLADTSTVQDCFRYLAEAPSLLPLPPALQRFARAMPETPKKLAEGRFPSVCFSALSNESLLESAERIASDAGYRVITDTGCDDWDYRDAAAYLFERAQKESGRGLPLCLLSGGEVTVSIAGAAGQGGRNQQWALEMGRLLAGRTGVVALSAGSDGVDGNSPAAGAVVDGTTWSRARAAGLSPEGALKGFDTYPLFARLGDGLTTGPSGNNLRDLRALFVHDPLL